MSGLIRQALMAICAALTVTALVPAHAQQAAPAAPAAPPLARADAPAVAPTARFAPPVGFEAPALPDAGETNAERSESQPGNNAPFWRSVRGVDGQRGSTTLPGVEKGTLIQSFVQYPGSDFTTAGEAWRQVRNRWIIPYGGALILVALVALALFYFARGPIGSGRAGGRLIERFTYFERAAHWSNAIAFCILAISGIVMAFGQFLLRPLIGATLFGWLAYGLKTLHNFAGPVFAVTLVIVLVTFVRDELFVRADAAWLKRFGGMFGGKEVPSPRFNAGEKVLYWVGALVLGVIVVGSGFVLDKLLPGLLYTRGDMQISHMVHSIAAMCMMALFLGHIYLGTIGMRGAYRGMRDGYVDEAWAQEHHELWYDDIKAGRIPAQRSQPTEPPARPVAQP